MIRPRRSLSLIVLYHLCHDTEMVFHTFNWHKMRCEGRLHLPIVSITLYNMKQIQGRAYLPVRPFSTEKHSWFGEELADVPGFRAE